MIASLPFRDARILTLQRTLIFPWQYRNISDKPVTEVSAIRHRMCFRMRFFARGTITAITNRFALRRWRIYTN